MNMLLEEWNLDEAKEVWLEEGREEGREEERNQILELIKSGHTTEQIAAKLSKGLQERK
jgi:DNA-binding NarL/FixJ family response regulator